MLESASGVLLHRAAGWHVKPSASMTDIDQTMPGLEQSSDR
jgi:hypothetical protein